MDKNIIGGTNLLPLEKIEAYYTTIWRKVSSLKSYLVTWKYLSFCSLYIEKIKTYILDSWFSESPEVKLVYQRLQIHNWTVNDWVSPPVFIVMPKRDKTEYVA